MYTSLHSKLIIIQLSKHPPSLILYADDTQVYVKVTPVNASTVIPELQSCLISIQTWMAGYKINLNPDKTDFIVFGPKTNELVFLNFSLLISRVTKFPQQINFVILVLFFILVLHFLLTSIVYVNRVSTTYVILPEFGTICVNQLLLH